MHVHVVFPQCAQAIKISPQCAQAIKELLDQRYGPSWHVVVGEGFGFDISYEVGCGLWEIGEMITNRCIVILLLAMKMFQL